MSALVRRRLIDDLHAPHWSLIAGVLLGLSFPPSPLYGLAYVALVPLLVRWSRLPLGWMLLREAYSAFLLMTAIAGHWVLLHESALTALTSGLGLLLIPIPLTIPVVVSALVRRRLGLRMAFAVLVTSWLALEWIISHGPGALPWLLLGNTQAEAFPFNQIAEIAGVGGLTLWVWCINGAVFWMLESRSALSRLALAACALGFMAAPLAYHSWRAPQLSPATASADLALVQPALGPREWADVRSGARVDLMASLASYRIRGEDEWEGTQPPSFDLVVWPETALPVYSDAPRQRALYSRLNRWATEHGVPLLTGAITRYDSAPALSVDAVVAERYSTVTPYYNSALLFDRDKLQQYDKIRMIPFAERVPLVEWRPALAALGVAAGGVGAYGLGVRVGPLDAGDLRFGTLICYESLFGDYARSLVADGAEFLVVLAQDGWWGRSAGYLQHFALTRLRAIETRRAVVMSTVTGRSGVILPDGSSPETTEWMEQTVHHASVPLATDVTMYTRLGDWINLLGMGLAALMLMGWGTLVLFFPERKKKRAHRSGGIRLTNLGP